MRRALLIHGILTLALAVAAGCNRAETRDQTQRAAADVKAAATQAGDKLADGWLTTRIQAQYFADDQIKARYIDVKTDDGVVTIKGFVETRAAHERALQIARSTSGVKQVNDQIMIGQPAAGVDAQRPVATAGELPPAPPPGGPTVRTDDGSVTSAIQAAFFLDPTVKPRHIAVSTQNGVVTLRGEVASEAERGQALMLARNASGVQRVEDHLSVNAALDHPVPSSPSSPTGVTPPVGAAVPLDDSAVAADVKAKLAADQQLRAVDVSVKEGVLELRGTVPSAAARQRAIELVRQSEGVIQVVDRLTLRP